MRTTVYTDPDDRGRHETYEGHVGAVDYDGGSLSIVEWSSAQVLTAYEAGDWYEFTVTREPGDG